MNHHVPRIDNDRNPVEGSTFEVRHSNTGIESAQTRAAPIAILESVKHLVGSAEPAVVFGSLAQLCAADFCDALVIDISEGDTARYRINYPRERGEAQCGPAAGSGQNVLGVKFSAGAEGATYAGTAWYSWNGYAPDKWDETVAALLVDRAVAVVEQHRLEADLLRAHDLMEDLQVSLVSNRHIGVAIGILMRTHAITEEVAFDRLRVASQNNRQQLRDITDEVVRVGYLDRCLVPTRRLWPRDVP